MAVTIVFGEAKLATTQLGSGARATVEFTPQEGPVEVTAFAAPVSPPKPARPGPGSGGGGKVDPNPEGGDDGPGVPPIDLGEAEVRVELFPPGADKPETAKTFRLEDFTDEGPPAPLKLGVRADEAGRRWKCIFRNTGGRKARVSGTVRFVRERIEDEPAAAEVSVDSHAELPVTHLRPADTATLRFKPSAGVVEISVFAAEVDLGPGTGKVDPNPDDAEDGVGVTLRQNVRIDAHLSGPGTGRVASGEYRSTDLLSEEAEEPVIRHTVPGALAEKTWECRFTNRGKKDVRCAASARFLKPALRTDIPLEVLNHALRQLIDVVGLTVRLDGTRAVIGVSDELREFAAGALGGDLALDLDFPGEFSDLNLYAMSVQARSVDGRPVIRGHAMFETSGEEVEGHLRVGVPLGPTILPVGVEVPVDIPVSADLARLAVTVELALRTVELNDRRVVQPISKVEVDVSAFGEVLSLIGLDVSDQARDKLLGKIRAVVESAAFREAVSAYLTEGLVGIVQQGHEFQDLLAEPGRFVVLHVNPDPTAPPQPPQPSEVHFPRPAGAEPAALDEASRTALAKIDHIVVLMQENRSFDHLLGYLSHPEHGPSRSEEQSERDVPDGLTGGESNPRLPGGTPVFMQPYTSQDVEVRINSFIHPTGVPFSPDHRHEHVLAQIAGGAMNGFVTDFVLRHLSTDPQFAMRFYTGEHLPVFDTLAARYAICDRWFCSHPGSTQPNRFCTLSGHTPVLDNFDLADPIYGYLRMTTIFDVLEDAGVDWAYYEGDIGFLRMYDRFRLDGEHLHPIQQFFKDAELGQLPRVSFIDPNFADIPPAATANDDHPPADLRFGQALISRIHDALAGSPRWITQDGAAGSLLVITYDEHGGFFDHVPPPGTASSEEPDPVAPVHPRGETFYGARVPTFAISPFIRAGRVDHTTYDHTSILTTILHRFVGEIPAELGPRVAAANHLAGLLELDEARSPGALPRTPAATIGRRFRTIRPEPDDFHAGMLALARPRA